MKNLMLVAKREYVKTIRKPSFWLATLAFPIFMIVVMVISGYSSMRTEEKIKEDLKNVKRILVVDQANIVNPAILLNPYEGSTDVDYVIAEVKSDKANVAIVFPSDLAVSQQITVYTKDEGIMALGKYDELARQLVKQSILLSLDDPADIGLFNSNLTVTSTYFKDGEVTSWRLEQFVVPAVSLLLYFVMVFMGTNFLLMSVSEEKENRMMEIVLTGIRSKELVWGKVLGITAIIITQLIVLIVLSVVGILFTINMLPLDLDWSQIPLNPLGIILNVFYIFCGFLVIASMMVGVGAAVPTYKDAQQFSSIFIIAAVFPLYFVTLIIAEPNGLVARLTSYFPLTAPMIMLGRNALGALPVWEMLLSIPILLVYVGISLYIAFVLFEVGAYEYNQKISLRRILEGIRKK